jgi:hypothetical protein
MSRIHNHKDPHKPRRQSGGSAGKFKKLHHQLTFTNRSKDPSLGLSIAQDASFDSNVVTILSNIPIEEDKEREQNYVIASRVHLFDVTIHARDPMEYMALIDVVYEDTGETVQCVTPKHSQKLLLDNQNTSRFELQDDEEDNVVIGMHSAKASFAVKIRETSRFHMKPTNNIKKKKSMIRKFVFRVSIFRCNFVSQIPELERIHVSDSASFHVIERKARDTTNKQSKKKNNNKRSREEEDENQQQQLNDKENVNPLKKVKEEQCDDENLKCNESLALSSYSPSMNCVDDILEECFNELSECMSFDTHHQEQVVSSENHHQSTTTTSYCCSENNELDFIREDQSPIFMNNLSTSCSLSMFVDPDVFMFNL